jgi:hypothetical protein
VIIDSSICVATTTGLPRRRAVSTMLFLDRRHGFWGQLDPQIAAGDHHAVGDARQSLRAGAPPLGFSI